MKKEYIGIKEAAQEASKYQGRVAIVFDQSDKKVWADCFPEGNDSWERYDGPSIITVYIKDGLYERNDKISEKWLQQLVEQYDQYNISELDDLQKYDLFQELAFQL